MTVSYVKAHEAELHNQVVRLRGEINNCSDRGCAICDENACLGLDLFTDTYDAHSLTTEHYRFATVVVDATIDASCDVDWDIDKYKTREEAERHLATQGRYWVHICGASIPVTEARVISVESRKSALSGRFDGFHGRYHGPAAIGLPMPEASEEQYGRVRGALKAMPWYDEDPSEQWKLYPDPDAESGPDSYYLCTCKEDDCENLWPSLSGQAIARSPANPYFCEYVSRGGNTWFVTR